MLNLTKSEQHKQKFIAIELFKIYNNCYRYSSQNVQDDAPIGAAKYVPATPPGTSSSMMTTRSSLESPKSSITSLEPEPCPSLMSKDDATIEAPKNELATKELNLLAQLIGADILANETQSSETFKISLFEQDKNETKEEKSQKYVHILIL